MNRPTSQKYIRIFCILTILYLASTSQSPATPEPILSPTSSSLSQHSLHPSMLPYHTLPIYGNSSLGYYYVNIYVGSPNPQPQSVIIDTGSGHLALPCADCKSCGHKNHIHPPYDYSKSQTSTILTCQSTLPFCQSRCQSNSQTKNCSFSIHYAEGSTLEGIMVEDQIRLQTKNDQSTEQIRTYFGCTQKQTKLFYDQKANGIFGLSPKRDSSILQQIFSKHSPFNGQKHIFSICLASNGGIMTVGSINKNLHPDKLQPDFSIPYNDKTNLYSLQGVSQIMLGQNFITSIMDRIGGHGIFIDSGATFSYLPAAKYNDVQRILNTTCIASKTCSIGRGEDSICYKLALQPNQLLQEEVDHLFPEISININNKQLKWAPRKYMLVREAKNNEVCLGILSLNRYLLGANWMQGRDIVFDSEKKLVHIFNDVECVQNAKSMSQYTTTLQNNPDLTFINKRQNTWEINTSSAYFMLGIGCFILSLVVGMIIMIGSSRKKKEREIILQDEQQDRTVQRIGSMGKVQIREQQQEV